MRIIGKQPDYYDSAQGMGIDKTLVYIRDPKKIELEKSDEDFRIDLIKNAPKFGDSQAFIIGFCGRVFPVIELHITTKKYKYGDDLIESFYVYNYEDLVSILRKYKIKNYLDAVLDKSKYLWKNEKKNVINFFDIGKGFAKFEDFFFANKTPVFVIVGDKEIRTGTGRDCMGMKHPKFENDGLIINNNLHDLEFYKIVDSFSAFQEIQMYIGGVIPRDIPDIVNISDDKMLEKKGFNDASFRKMPDLRRRKQKKGKVKVNK